MNLFFSALQAHLQTHPASFCSMRPEILLFCHRRIKIHLIQIRQNIFISGISNAFYEGITHMFRERVSRRMTIYNKNLHNLFHHTPWLRKLKKYVPSYLCFSCWKVYCALLCHSFQRGSFCISAFTFSRSGTHHQGQTSGNSLLNAQLSGITSVRVFT